MLGCAEDLWVRHQMTMNLESTPVPELSCDMMREAEEFLDGQDTGHPFQFPQWGGANARMTVLRSDGRIRWLATFSLHRPLGRKAPWIRAASAVRGPVCDDEQLWSEGMRCVVGQLSREGIAYLETSPERVRSRSPLPENCAGDMPRSTLRLDLTASEDDLLANCSKTTRYEIRRAERVGVAVDASSGSAAVAEFQCLYKTLGEKKRFATDPASAVQARLAWIQGSDSRGALLLARAEGAVRGGAVIARAGRRCWYIWGASEKQGVSVGHLLQWRALQWAKAHGCAEYDFGGYRPGATSGPAWFKAGFGGKPVHFDEVSRTVLRPTSYRVFQFMSKLAS